MFLDLNTIEARERPLRLLLNIRVREAYGMQS